MKVHELISLLQTMPQDADVAYRLYSERCLLDPDDIRVIQACAPRPDGWIQDQRADMPSQTYVSFPGN